MKFKILTARSPEKAQEEIERSKSFCDVSVLLGVEQGL